MRSLSSELALLAQLLLVLAAIVGTVTLLGLLVWLLAAFLGALWKGVWEGLRWGLWEGGRAGQAKERAKQAGAKLGWLCLVVLGCVLICGLALRFFTPHAILVGLSLGLGVVPVWQATMGVIGLPFLAVWLLFRLLKRLGPQARAERERAESEFREAAADLRAELSDLPAVTTRVTWCEACRSIDAVRQLGQSRQVGP